MTSQPISDTMKLWEHLFAEHKGTLCVASAVRATDGTKKLGPFRQKFVRYPAQAALAANWLQTESQAGRETYSGVHLLTAGRRKKEFAAPLRALYVDGDGAQFPDTLPQPTAVVRSSPGRDHFYFRLDRPVDPEVGHDLNQRLAQAIGADPSGADLTQVLRPPGTTNHKYEDEPTVELYSMRDFSYDPDELDRLLPPLAARKKKGKHPAAHTPPSETNEPPVRLEGNDLLVWKGEAPKRTPDGEVDRSASLVKIAGVLHRKGVTRAGIVAALLERDVSLGWQKYSDRDDCEEQLQRIVDLVQDGGDDSEDGESALAATGMKLLKELRDATHPEDVIQRILDDKDSLTALAIAADEDSRAFEAATLWLRSTTKVKFVESLMRLVKDVQRSRAAERDAHQTSTALVVSCVADAPVEPTAEVPGGWVLNEQGVFKMVITPALGVTLRPVTPSPVVIVSWGKDVDDGTEFVGLAFKRDGRWANEFVERVRIANGREIVGLAARGFPVTSQNAGPVVQYLADYEAANRTALEKRFISHRFGWQGKDGADGFLLGRKLLRPDGTVDECDDPASIPAHSGNTRRVAFKGINAGDEQAVDAFSVAGTFEQWRNAWVMVRGHARAAIAPYVALTPLLLELLGVQNFIVDWSFTSSAGKTTTLRLAASVWGSPDQNAGESLVASWDATRVWTERRASVFNSLPLILDETKRAKYPKDVSKFLYDFASGQGKGRGALDGMRASTRFRSVMLTSGESPATSFTEDGGTRARVLEIWGSPFGREDEATGALVRDLNARISSNHGHAGAMMVAYMLKNRELWPSWKQQFGQIEAMYTARAGDNEVASRLASYMAAVEMTAAIAHEALHLDWSYRETLDAVWLDVSKEAAQADRATAALEYALGWAVGHQSQFWSSFVSETHTSGFAGWAGRWDSDDGNWATIDFLPPVLKKALEEGGFEYEAVKRIWRDRGWLLLDRDGKDHRARVGGPSVRVVAIKRDIVDEVSGGQGTGKVER